MPDQTDLSAFLNELTQRVLIESNLEESENFREDQFTQMMIDYMIDASEISDGTVCYHRNRGVKVNGYYISEDQDVLDLLVCECHLDAVVDTINRTEIETILKRARSFFLKSKTGYFRELEEANEAFDLAHSIHELRNDISRVRVFLFTDRVSNVKEMPNDISDKVEFSYHIWDLQRLLRFESSGRTREKIEVDFVELFGEPLKCLPASSCSSLYRCYLAVLPGTHVVNLYSKYGPRLLERNVRSFLQVKGNVNKGIRKTLQERPEMFLAYNNGLTAVAQSVTVETIGGGGSAITKLIDFQIVNGGQTTGSIYDAYRKSDTDLTSVFVPVKITEITDIKSIDSVAPEISRCANSQNKVNTADFSANDPFHIQTQELSRVVWAPAPQGAQQQTKWFYERARGQYSDERSRAGTPARVRAFESEYPKPQMFTKTDLAKFEHSWDQLPHWVSRGSQKNFSQFAIRLADRGRVHVDELYYRRLIAKAILFRQTESLVSAERFGGYRSNIVTYTVAWLSNRTAQRINLDLIWRNQDIGPTLVKAIKLVCRAAHKHITNPPDGANVTEWCKKEKCWELFQHQDIHLPTNVDAELVSEAEVARGHGNERGIENPTPEEEELISAMMAVGATAWFQIAKWARETNNLQAWQRGLAYSLGRLIERGQRPSRKQASHGKGILEEATRLGFVPKDE